MKTLVFPYGRPGWERKKRFFEELIISRRGGPPYIYNDVLIVAPSSRIRRTYGKLFLEAVQRLYGATALIQPEIRTLHQFFHSLYSSLDGPAVIDENSRLLLLEGIVKQRLAGSAVFNQDPDVLAPSLSAAVAGMIEQLSAAGITPEILSAKTAETDFSDKPQVRLLTDVYGRYARILNERGMTDPAGMLSFLIERFDPRRLAPYTAVVIDGVNDAGALEAHLLRKIAAQEKCIWLIDAPSSALIMRSGEFHPLRTTSDVLTPIGVLPGEDAAVLNPDDRFLSEILFSDKSFADISKRAAGLQSFGKKLNLFSAINIREEVSLIARQVKKSLQSGTTADSILVTFPSLDEYGPLVEEIFTDYGLPYNRALGRQLSASAVVTSVISLLRARREDFSGPSLIRVLSAPFLKFGENPGLAPALDKFMRDRSIPGGGRRLLAALDAPTTEIELRELLEPPLKELINALEPFNDQRSAPLSVWMDSLSQLIVWSGLGAGVSKIHGPLNINLQAQEKLNETLASLGRAGRLFPEYQYTLDEWFFLLKKTFMHTRFQVPPEDEGGVQLLGLRESAGMRWNEIYLGGLVDGKFPLRLPQNIFLPEAALEALGVHTLERARLSAAHHFYRLILSAESVTLTYPENEQDRPTVPSPFLSELAPLEEKGIVNRSSRIQFSLRVEDSGSVPELSKAVGVALHKDRDAAAGLSQLLTAGLDGMAGIKSAMEFKAAESTPVVTPSAKREFRVTELDDYLKCPYDYYIRHVLKIGPLEEVTEDISALDRGSKVHAILRNFNLSWNKPVTRENRDEAGTLLKSLADTAFDGEADTFRNRREKERFLTVMAERFLDAEEKFWKQGMRPAYLEQKIEFYKITLSDGVKVELHAKIDRIDVDENGDFIIVDYKTGGYPRPKMNVEQDIFQLPVYAVMAREALSGKSPALKRPIGLAYYDLSGKNKASARDVVLFNKEAREDHPATKPKASPRSAADFETILQQGMDKARKAVEGIRAGVFPAAPRDENKCRSCPNELMCEAALENRDA